MQIQKNIPLSPLTTIKLGGKADFFAEVKNEDELREAIRFAKKNHLKIHFLGGGSNTVFPDANLKKLVIKISITGISFKTNGKNILATAKAGVVWDDLVSACIKKDFQGLETLSGIPGTVGASPVQNIGAYGSEVSSVIKEVKVLDLKTLKEKIFSNKNCLFSYRNSRFRGKDKDKFVIIEVSFILKKNFIPKISYLELKNELPAVFSLEDIRFLVLKIRRRKSMLINPQGKNLHSCGSFFINPKLTQKEFCLIEKKFPGLPHFSSDKKIKIPAAWLIENSGFKKGYKTKNTGLSKFHALSIINRGGKTKDILALAEKIKKSVYKKFHLLLKIEPEIVKSN